MKTTTFHLGDVKLVTAWPDQFIKVEKKTQITSVTIGRTYKGILNTLDGNYAIFTKSGLKFVLRRDKFGSIPIYYSIEKKMISTEIHAFASTDDKKISECGTVDYLDRTFFLPGNTIQKGVNKLNPDETLIIDNNRIKIEKCSNYYPEIENSYQNFFEEALELSIKNIVKITKGKVLLNLSGGNDSTLIAFLLRKFGSSEIFTNTFYHSDWKNDFDDHVWAKKISNLVGTEHFQCNIHNEIFEGANLRFINKTQDVFHTYGTAFFNQLEILGSHIAPEVAVVNGSGPDECIIGTEKISITELISMNKQSNLDWEEYISLHRDYKKIDQSELNLLLQEVCETEEDKVKTLFYKASRNVNFLDFQRRFHSELILQDHIRTISAASLSNNRAVFFPYLSNDIFDIVFSTSFLALNAGGIYKQIIKKILKQFVGNEIIYRKKIGFQSPSRKYFMQPVGCGKALQTLLKMKTNLFNNDNMIFYLNQRLNQPFDNTVRYDFLEWGIFNILRLEKKYAETN